METHIYRVLKKEANTVASSDAQNMHNGLFHFQ
jgi:hypothetical protein